MKDFNPSSKLVVVLVSAMLFVSCNAATEMTATTVTTTTSDTTTTVTTSAITLAPSTTEPSIDRPSVVEIEIDAGDVVLVGDLYLPVGSGPHPGVVLVHGSGPQSRSSELSGQLNLAFGFTIPVFTELAEGLQSAGYAVLTYDKRTCGRFNGCAENDYPVPVADLTIETLIDDTGAALDAIAARPEVDERRLVVIGHSQGAGFVPELMDGTPGVVAGVLLAGAHDAPDALVAAQALFTRELLDTLSMTPEQVDVAVAPLDAAADDLRRVRDGEQIERSILGAPASFWETWMDQADGVPVRAANLERPILVLGGDLDWNVPPDQAEAWQATLEGSTTAHRVVILPCVTHALNCVAESDPAQISLDDIGREVAPEVIEAIVTFLRAQA